MHLMERWKLGLHDKSHGIVKRISSVKPVLSLLVNIHHVLSDGAAFNTQSRRSLTSYAISRSLSEEIHLRLWMQQLHAIYHAALMNTNYNKWMKSPLITWLKNPVYIYINKMMLNYVR